MRARTRRRAFVIQARGNMVVEVQLEVGTDLAAAGRVLQEQNERLSAVEGPIP
jgi:hypothetical protein